MLISYLIVRALLKWQDIDLDVIVGCLVAFAAIPASIPRAENKDFLPFWLGTGLDLDWRRKGLCEEVLGPVQRLEDKDKYFWGKIMGAFVQRTNMDHLDAAFYLRAKIKIGKNDNAAGERAIINEMLCLCPRQVKCAKYVFRCSLPMEYLLAMKKISPNTSVICSHYKKGTCTTSLH
jgi:hypothetical protein